MPYRPHTVLRSLHNTSPSIYSTSGTPFRPIKSSCPPPFVRQGRQYAQHADEPAQDQPHSKEHQWPNCPRQRSPTPYEILNLSKGAPYSKRVFYELVKIYHPDRDTQSAEHIGELSRAVRLERYRLVVSANEILSDPAKRKAYDKFGAGWEGVPQMPRRRRDRDDDDYRFWTDQHSPAHNATWEDWERWYRRRDGKHKQEPQYTSNEYFVGLIIMFIGMGAWFELGRGLKLAQSYKGQVDARHKEVSEGLAKRRGELEELSGQDARVQNFLRVRKSGYRYLEPAPPPATTDASSRKSLPPPSSLTSGWK